MPRSLTDTNHAKILELYWVHGINAVNIGKRYGCSAQRIRDIINAAEERVIASQPSR
jgi:Mor family transcriptional regulator